MADTAQDSKLTVEALGDRQIRAERVFNAPREKVYRAMTDPELIPQWWGRHKDTMTVEELDVRVGGRWRFVSESEDGRHGFSGVFRELEEPSRVVQTFEWDGMPGYISVDSAELEDLGDGRTRATYRLDGDPGRVLGMMIRGPVEGRLREILVGGRPGELAERMGA